MKGVSLLIRGTCQQFKFKTPYLASQIKAAKITFWQENNEGTENCPLPITKTLTDCVADPESPVLLVTLNQVETLAFSTESKAYAQFRGLTVDDFAFGSKIFPITVYPVKDDTVLE